MELRHLRYFFVVGEVLNFTKASARLRVAQPSLSRQIRDLEDEIGVDLLKRSPRGVTLTAEGRLFLEEVRDLLKRADESVEKVRALARGHYGELHIGYSPSPTIEILPPALAGIQKELPRVNVLLHDASRRELIHGLQEGTFEIAIMPDAMNLETAGIEFEPLRDYPFHVAFAPVHPFARLKSVSLEKLAMEPLVGFSRKDYPDYLPVLERIFEPVGLRPRIVLECDSASSLITAIESGRGVAVTIPVMKIVSGKRLGYRPLAGTAETISIGIARKKNGERTPAGEKFCELLREAAQSKS